MVQSEPLSAAAHRQNARRYAALGAAAGVVAVCAVVVMATHTSDTNLVAKPNELYMDSMKVANKILANQKFKKANMAERKSVVKSILAGGHEHPSGKKVVSKVATIVANTHLSYHQRMEAMKKLLDSQTDEIKEKPIQRVDEPKHAAKKAHKRGRATAHKSKAQVADDNKKAMSDGAKLAKTLGEAKKHKDLHSALQAKEHAKKTHSASTSADAKSAKPSMTAKAAKALKEGEKLMHETAHAKHKLTMKHKLHMSAKDEKIKKASEKTAADPKAAHKWISKEASTKAKKAVVKKIAAQKKAAGSVHGSKKQKLIKWAEAHGMPKKLAQNPKDKQKVKDIIARMKADLMVEKIKAQFKHDDSAVGGIIHASDPSAASSV